MKNIKSLLETIINQLGGNNFISVIGNDNIQQLNNNKVEIKLSKNMSQANYLTIDIKPDSYSMQFFNKSNNEQINVKTLENVHQSILQGVFSRVTGMYFS